MKRFRKAEVTLELAVGLMLSAVVLILVIGMFHDNTATLANNTNFKNLTGDTSNKTDYEAWETDPADVNISGAAGVGGLSFWNNTALAEIEDILSSGALSKREKRELAKWLTVYGCSGTTDPNSTLANSPQGDLYTLASNNEIYPRWGYGVTKVIIGGRTEIYTWRNDDNQNSQFCQSPDSSNDDKRARNAQYISQYWESIKALEP